VDRRQQADGGRDAHRHDRDDERPQDHGQDVEHAAAREPADREQVRQVDLAEEFGRLEHEGKDDGHADGHGDRGGQRQGAGDDPLLPAPSGIPREEWWG